MTIKNILLAAGLMAGSVMTVKAETIDAADYFSGNPLGWATCSDEAGTAYAMLGGMTAAQPKTVILKASGSTDDAAIIAAVANNDIIVLDGSNGDFTIERQMLLNNAKHKTIVGKNNARLCTKFILTPEIHAALESYNLEDLSSTDQYTGTLPNGQTITCDKRAFFTKKAIMEVTKDYDLACAKSGIFALNSTDEDIIFRNITFVGPGSIDVDGVDLITNQESRNVWVDHCTFIDALDGALDSKRCDFATYTWNHFYYTERSFSHAYTCACGWVEDHNMVLHLTFANNVWGKGCQRRLPQADDCFIHLFNNYLNCAGNSVGSTINSYARAIVEFNYAAENVKEPLTGSGSERYVYAHDNSYSVWSNNSALSVPYSYTTFANSLVPQVLTASHGAGATLDYYMPGETKTLSAETFGFYQTNIEALLGNKTSANIKNILGVNYTITSSNTDIVEVDADGILTPKAVGSATITVSADDAFFGKLEQTLEVVVKEPNNYTEVYNWDFTKQSAETKQLLAASAWTAGSSTDQYICPVAHSQEALKIGTAEYPEAKGLLFTFPATKFQTYKNKIRFDKEDVCSITIKNLCKDDRLTITVQSCNSTSERGFNATNLSESQMLTISQKSFKAVVLADGDVLLTATGGIYVVSIKVERQLTATAISKTTENTAKAVSGTYDLMGRKVGNNVKGIVIKDGVKQLRR